MKANSTDQTREAVVVAGTQTAVAVTDTALQAAKTAVDWHTLAASFVAAQEVKQSSRRLYARTILPFFKWVEGTGRNLASLSDIDLKQYADSLLEEGLSNNTRCSYIVTLRKFYEWAEYKRLYPNIARSLKTPKRAQEFEKQHLTNAKSKELLQHFQESSLRDFAIVNLLLRTGLRTVEVTRANVGDIALKSTDETERRVLMVQGKGHDEKDDFVILTGKAWEPIERYLKTCRKGAKAGEALFTSTSHQNGGQRLTTRTISGLVKEGLRAIGLDSREYTAHSLRHTCAVEILKKNGLDLSQAQAVLRHSSSTTTEIYVKSIKKEQRLNVCPESLLDDVF